MKGDNNNLMMNKRQRQKKKKMKMMEWSVKKDELEVAEILVDFVNLHAAQLSLMPVLNLSRNLSCWAAGKRSIFHRRCVRKNFSDPFNLLLSSAGGLNYSKKSSSPFPNQTPPPPPSSSCEIAAAITKVYSRKKGFSGGDYHQKTAPEENANSTNDGYQFSSFNDYNLKSQEQKVVITIDRDEREEPEVAQIVEDEEHAPIVVPEDDDQEPLIMDPTVVVPSSRKKREQYHHDYKYGELRGLPSSPPFVEGDEVVILSDSDGKNHSEAVILISDSDRMGGAKPSKDSEVVILSESSTAKSSKQYSEVVGINRKDKHNLALCSNIIPNFSVNLLKSPLSVN